MQPKTVRIVVVSAVLAVFAVAMVTAGCAQTTPTPTTTTAQPSTAPSSTTSAPSPPSSTPPPALTGVDLGKKIWDTGADNSGTIPWTLGKAGIKTGACAQCHGKLGKGGIGPNITYPKIKADFPQAKFVQAVMNGLDEAGKALDKKMPRYGTMPAEDGAAVYAYVKTLK